MTCQGCTPPPTTLTFAMVDNPPPMQGLPPSIVPFSQFLGVNSLYAIYCMDNGLHAQASPNILRLCPPSLAPRPRTFSKHLSSHSHTLFYSFRYSPEHFLARLSLRLAPSLQSLPFYTHFWIYTHSFISSQLHNTDWFRFQIRHLESVTALFTYKSCD